MLARIRKALTAGVGAGLAAVVTLLFSSGIPTDAKQVGALAGAFLAGAVPIFWATWQVPNARALAPYTPK
jgi:uncharacterized membrane protein YjjB (DUF3815 family)